MSPEAPALQVPNDRALKIAPSILAANPWTLGEQIARVEAAGADWLHVDVMDGHFVPNIAMGPDLVGAVNAETTIPLDVHLMIEKPERYLGDFIENGADTVGVHVETCPHLHRTLGDIRERGARACAVINPGTPAESLFSVLDECDQVLVMTVNPGFGGQKFIPEMMSKVTALRNEIGRRGLEVDIEVDGGIGTQNVGIAAAAGANVFVAGTAVFKAPDYAAVIETLKSEAAEARG